MTESRFERNVGAAMFAALLVAAAAIGLHIYVPWENETLQAQMSFPMAILWGAAAIGLAMLLFTLFRSQHHTQHDVRISDEDTLRRFEEADRQLDAADRQERTKPFPP
ncbi:MAG: hypothetical protein CFE29_04445 [Bradyrhizobiaceae bacterium PARB1]|jgi:uncharacterized membrane protein YjfL (UPF0719 family)|nr:MAG: hypothetical protein CFE29_04445 [Bradyrhizobiaceae bacterium PARB1]